MTENSTTKKIHPSPAKEQKPARKPSGQSDGQNQDIAGTEGEQTPPDVIQEQEKSKQGYEKSA